MRSVADAFRGIWDCIKSERNMRIHFTASCYVIVCSFQLGLTRVEHAVLFLAIGGVLAAEMLNTSIEKLCDFNQKNYSHLIKIIKDIAAGAVLVAALISVVVGVFILLRPSLFDLALTILYTPFYLLLFVLSLIAAVFFVFWGPVKIADKLKDVMTGNNAEPK